MTDPADLDHATTLPAATYSDPDWFEQERHAIFAATWQLVGFRTHLRQSGDYLTHAFAGFRVLVVINGQGELRAFHNVCRHRAGPLATEPTGHCPVIVCGYHGWTYDLDGGLTRAREFGAEDFNPEEFGLLAVAVDEWRGLVFVRIAPNGPTLADALGGFADRCTDQPIESLTYSQRLTHTIDANWKTYTDNYCEGYHIPFVHPGLHAQIRTNEYRVDVGDGFTEHRVPTRDGATAAGVWLWRFPNLALNIYPEGMNVERWIPDGPRRTTVTYDCLVTDPAATEANAEIVRLGVAVLDEDRTICELVQANLESGVYDRGQLSPRHENGVYAFQTWVRAAMDASAQDASAGSSSNASEFTQ